jgi:hypothetical protein
MTIDNLEYPVRTRATSIRSYRLTKSPSGRLSWENGGRFPPRTAELCVALRSIRMNLARTGASLPGQR